MTTIFQNIKLSAIILCIILSLHLQNLLIFVVVVVVVVFYGEVGFVPFNEFVRPDNNTIGTSTVSVPKLVVCLPNSDTDSWIAAIDTVRKSQFMTFLVIEQELFVTFVCIDDTYTLSVSAIANRWSKEKRSSSLELFTTT
jgi:hypothetical protein